uniref:Alpha/beta hydrolase domain-containing protein n=1 Tax=Solibacter usitatus (strain Ellin6076) TaxID=234267 RepID=Q01R31_SOLUE
MLLRTLTGSLIFGVLSHAALLRIEIKERSDVPNSAYEQIVGRAYFSVDPGLRANAGIVDLDKAARNGAGQVEFSSDLYLLRPKSPAAGNGTVLFEVSNRGGKSALGMFNRGDQFLFDRGFTVAWIGWQFDVPERPELLRLYAPIAKGVTGIVRSEIVVDRREMTHSVADRNHRPYPVLRPDDPALALTVRDRVEGPRTTVPRGDWHIEDGTTVALKGGFQPGRLYELVYTAQDPPVAGLGMAAIRDFISYMKYGGAEGAPVKRAIGYGVSQSGRFLRAYLYDGFNQDEKDRKVFDGVMAHVAGAGRGSFNVRFAQPSRDGHPFLNTLYPTDLFPFTDLEEIDPATGAKGGLLVHAGKPETWPKIFYTNSSYEYYGRDAALIHSSPDGKKDAPLAANTRVYFFNGGQHGPAAFPPPHNGTQNSSNPNPYTWSLRAMLAEMNAWITDGTAPPASVYPKVSADQAVAPGAVQFPKIPGVTFPARTQRAWRADYGPQFAAGIVTVEPPKLGAPFATLVPQVDRDGNEIGGIRMPEIQAPLGTYTGWNLRAQAIGAPDEMYSMQGSWIPFALTRKDRERSGDSRLSIEERYTSREDYLEKFAAAGKSLVAAGFLLEGDLPQLLRRGAAEWDYLHR